VLATGDLEEAMDAVTRVYLPHEPVPSQGRGGPAVGRVRWTPDAEQLILKIPRTAPAG
jgi:hypothetical protein